MKKILFLATTMFVTLFFRSNVLAKKHRNNWIKKKRTSYFTYYMSRTRISPSRFIISQGRYNSTSGEIFDIKTGKYFRLPDFRKAINIYSPKKKAGIHWKWGRKKVVYYNHKKGIAGYWVEKLIFKKIGTPKCPCGSRALFWKGDSRYHCYCKGYKKALPDNLVLKKTYEQLYFELDIKTNKVLKQTSVGKGRYTFIGIDNKGTYLYAGKMRDKKNNIYNKPAKIIRLNLTSHKVDWKFSLKLPVRKNSKGPYSIQYKASDDYRFFAVYEFDIKLGRSNRGYLKNPYPKGYIVDRKNKTSFSFEAPVEVWTSVFDKKNHYYFINSYQKGEITRINLKTKKIQTFKRVKRTYYSAVSSDSKYLYNFSLKGLTIYKTSTMKKVKYISKNHYLGRNYKTSGEWYNMQKSNNIILGLWKKRKISPSGHINARHEFAIYEIK